MSNYSWAKALAVLLAAAGLLVAPAAQAACSYTVTLVSPAAGASYVAPANIALVADADGSPDGCSVSAIKFYNGATLLAQVSPGADGSFSYTWSGVGVGSYTVKAVTANGAASAQANITVNASQPPTVSMAAPTGPFIAPATIGLSATASDADGSVSKVEFFQGATLIATDTTAPYQASYSAAATGTYSFTAKATDNTGLTQTSAPVSATIVATNVIGNVEDVRFESPDYKLYGWACSTGRNQSIAVHVYAGGAYGTGTFVTSATANLASEAAVANSCQAQGTAYRYAITLTPAMRQQFANQKIYVHGISPDGLANNLLNGSGVLSIPPPLSLTRSYVYNANQELCEVIEPETGATFMGYDAAGNLSWSAAGMASSASCADAATVAGRRVDRTYDGRNRLTTLVFPDGRGNQAWTYEVDNLPSQITTYNTAGNGTPVINAYSYNRRRMLAGESLSQPGWYTWSIGYSYNQNAALQGQTYPTSLYIDYAPNALGQATRAGTYATGVSYYPNGGIKQFTYGNGLTHTMTQNARQLPARVTDGGGALDYDYGYDANGNVDHIYDYIPDLTPGTTARHRWMQYDGLDRLSAVGSAIFGGDQWHRFTYDALDNLRSWKLAGVKDYSAYYYDASNRLTNIKNSSGSSIVGLDYDPQGNLRTKNGQEYDFDYGNRQRAVVGKEAYRYDGYGRRVLEWNVANYNVLTIYSQAGQMLYRANGKTNTNSDHIYLGGSLVAIRDTTGQVRYQHTDALGSPVAMTNEAGQVVERTDYEPYGVAINKTVDGVGYTGHVMDAATGLTYMQQRYYDPQIGRFLSIDPVKADGNAGGNFNRYWYADDNPYRFTDPDGRAPKDRWYGYDDPNFQDWVHGEKQTEGRGAAQNYTKKELDRLWKEWNSFDKKPRGRGGVSGRGGSSRAEFAAPFLIKAQIIAELIFHSEDLNTGEEETLARRSFIEKEVRSLKIGPGLQEKKDAAPKNGKKDSPAAAESPPPRLIDTAVHMAGPGGTTSSLSFDP